MKNKLYKVLGVVLSIALVLTAVFCLPAVAEDVVDEAKTVDYYVQSPGYESLNSGSWDTGLGTKESPAATVADLIAIINDDPEMTANDTANVYIMQRSDWNEYGGTLIGRELNDAGEKTGVVLSPQHSMTSWVHATAHNAINTMEDHSWTMVVKADPDLTNADSGKIYLAYSDRLGANKSLYLHGPTVFENVTLVCTRKDYMSVIPNGNNITYETTCTHGILDGIDYNDEAVSTKVWSGKVTTKLYSRFALYEGAVTDTDGVTLNMKHNFQLSNHFYVPNSGAKANTTVDGDINLTFDNEKIKIQKFIWGVGNASYTHTFNSININVKAATSIVNTAGKGTAAVANGVQVIVNPNTTYTTDLTELSTVSIPTNDAGVKKYWKLVNTGDADAISFVADENGDTIVGKYNIKEFYTATATDAEGNTYDSKDGVLDLSEVPGTYTVTFVKGAVTKDYYVQSVGWEALDSGEYEVGLGTKESPAATVKDVIDIINEDGLVAGDTANVYIMNHSDVGNSESLKYDGSVIGIDSSSGSNVYHIPYHSLTAWQHTSKNVSTGGSAPAAHTFNLVIKVDPAATETVYLAYADTIGNGNIYLSGPTVFEDITIVSTRSYWNSVIANGNDITYGENCKFGAISMDYSKNYSEGNTWDGEVTSLNALNTYLLSDTNDLTFDGMNVEINTKYSSSYKRYLYMGKGIKAATFTGDYNLTIDHASASPDFYWGNTAETSTLALTNLNIHVKQGVLDNLVANDATTNVMTADAVQVIAENVATVNNLETVLAAKNLTNYWYIKNGGDAGIISFRRGEDGNAIAGTFTVAEGYDVTAVNTSTGEEVTSANGVLDLTGKPGSYTLLFKDAQTNNYSDYINVRNGLGNTYSKLTKDKELNVVYFGGSVTSGYGSTDSSLYSWRALVGSWLTTNFPVAKVTNYDQAIGETGTQLGLYRIVNDVISKKPDLLFIEYSINDYYDWDTSNARINMRFETIVRQVREKLPNCDIVTILVTDHANADGTLHSEAQQHEAISEAYNIPSIHVGRAFVDKLKADGWERQSTYTNDETWKTYMTDNVHPTDAGYAVYFDVIKEFLNNELNYGEYDGTYSAIAKPEMVNKYILDGDMTFIDADYSNATLSFTSEHTKTGYYPDMSGVTDNNGLIRIFGTDTVTVKFTGTELIMLTKGGNEKDHTFKISVDGGDWITKNYPGKNPVVVVSGLEAGEHTVEILLRDSGFTEDNPETTDNNEEEDARINAFYSRNAEKASNRLNICDLVDIAETTSAQEYMDYNNDQEINTNDIATLKKILLNNK